LQAEKHALLQEVIFNSFVLAVLNAKRHSNAFGIGGRFLRRIVESGRNEKTI